MHVKTAGKSRHRGRVWDRLEYHAVVGAVFVPTYCIETAKRALHLGNPDGSTFDTAISVARTAAGYAFKH